MKSEDIKDLAKALSIAQGQIKGAIKDSENPFFKSAYADLASVWEAIREPLSKNGLSVVQTTEYNETTDRVLLRTTIIHSTGQFMTGLYPLKPKVEDPQGMGSAMSYARRYCLAAIVGVYQTDDDANMASQKQNQHPKEIYELPKKPIDQRIKTDAVVIEKQLEKMHTQAAAATHFPVKQKPALAGKVGDHEHAWKNSQYPGDFGEDMEYCITCKIKRPKQIPKDDEIPF